jgi:HD-GYP domain-containing protein (c-di-GMP phosphodiesterase class II)
MTGERPYKNRLGKKEAINQLRENSGTQFDPEIVEVFISKVLGSELEPEEAQPESGDALIDIIEKIAP